MYYRVRQAPRNCTVYLSHKFYSYCNCTPMYTQRGMYAKHLSSVRYDANCCIKLYAKGPYGRRVGLSRYSVVCHRLDALLFYFWYWRTWSQRWLVRQSILKLRAFSLKSDRVGSCLFGGMQLSGVSALLDHYIGLLQRKFTFELASLMKYEKYVGSYTESYVSKLIYNT